MDHLITDQIEMYAMCNLRGQLNARRNDTEIRHIEDHIFVCQVCRQHLTEFNVYVAAMQFAAAHLDSSDPVQSAQTGTPPMSVSPPIDDANGQGLADAKPARFKFHDRDLSGAVLSFHVTVMSR